MRTTTYVIFQHNKMFNEPMIVQEDQVVQGSVNLQYVQDVQTS